MPFQITYNGNGNTGGTAPSDANFYVTGAKAIAHGNDGNLTKGDKKFAYWNTKPDNSGQHYFPNDNIVIGTSNITLFAQWYSSDNLRHGGVKPNFNIFYLDTPDTKLFNIAQAIEDNCENAFFILKDWFNVSNDFGPGHKIEVRVEPMTWREDAGAWNGGYNLGIIDVNSDSVADDIFIDNVSMHLLVAELSEIFMDYCNIQRGQNTWVSGESDGEGLSQFCAAELYPINDVRINNWLQLPDRNSTANDWISAKEISDGNIISYGQALLFLYYLKSQLNYSQAEIIQHGSVFDLSSTYTNLTGRFDGYTSFTNLLNYYYPVGRTPQFDTNNIFPIPKTSLPPRGISLQVIAVREFYSHELREYWIGIIRAEAANGKIYELFRPDVVRLIDAGFNSFYTLKRDGTQTPVIVIIRNNHECISSEPNETKEDNLLFLPRF
jgi:hypothetical protein